MRESWVSPVMMQIVERKAQEILDTSERRFSPVSEAPPGERGGPCFACGLQSDFRVTFVHDGEEAAWVNACAAHRDTPVVVGLS